MKKSQMNRPQMKKSHVNVVLNEQVSNVVVSNELVLIVMEPFKTDGPKKLCSFAVETCN